MENLNKSYGQLILLCMLTCGPTPLSMQLHTAGTKFALKIKIQVAQT